MQLKLFVPCALSTKYIHIYLWLTVKKDENKAREGSP